MILADFLLPGSVLLKRIRIRLTKMKRIHTDPDPQHWFKVACSGEVYKVVKRGRSYRGSLEEYKMEKGEMESTSLLPLILRLLGENIKWGRALEMWAIK